MKESIGWYYNTSKNNIPKYKIVNLIMLNCKNLQMHQLTKRVDYTILERLCINEIIFPIAMKLKLLDS
jgi:hypothetical protein